MSKEFSAEEVGQLYDAALALGLVGDFAEWDLQQGVQGGVRSLVGLAKAEQRSGSDNYGSDIQRVGLMLQIMIHEATAPDKN